ncbi:MAG: hypothetical protein OXG04_22790 [Acidobacteria bacterium]|nr:hypothetical protein [Acidobacteriota bacterium]
MVRQLIVEPHDNAHVARLSIVLARRETMTTRALWSLLVAIGLFCLAGSASAQDTTSRPWLHVQIFGVDHDDDHHDDDGYGDDDGRHDGEDDDGERHHDEDGQGDGDGRRDDGDEDRGDDDGQEGADFNVNINVPLAAVEPLLRLVPHDILSEGRLAMGDRDVPVDVAAMRGLWGAISDIGDAEFLTVDSEDETVSISRTGDQILVQMAECDENGGETVDIRLPVVVLDALLSGDDETLDVGAAVEHLADLRGDIVRVSGDDHQLRVWIDEVARPSK